MPRKLPWANQGAAASKTQVKLPSKPTKRIRTKTESDDEFFAGTILESSRKGKVRAEAPESEDELPELPKPSASKVKGGQRRERALSSSPPPAVLDLPPPSKEPMRKGVNKFDLRDDEWMMVEDEFLQTAKLFTRHLHLAEYERLKEIIQTKKEVARPVVVTEKPSDERQMQIKAEKKATKQREALKDAISSSSKEDIADYLGPAKRTTSDKIQKSPFSGSGRSDPVVSDRNQQSNASDSDDLDAPSRPSHPKRDTSSAPFVKPALPSASQVTSQTTSSTSSAKPAIPSTSRIATPRASRASIFDSFDDYPSKRSSSPTKPTQAVATPSSSPPKPSQTSTTRSFPPTKSLHPTTRPSQSFRVRPSHRAARSVSTLFDDDDLPGGPALPKEHADRLAHRKAEREKEKEAERRKSIQLDDIPTFLF